MELYPIGPLQPQLVAPVAAPVNVRVPPTQTGLGDAEGVTPVGALLTTTLDVVAVVVPQLFIALSV